MEKNPYEIDFESYIREGEPDKKEKSIAWSIATGLQQVDGLTPSAYLYKTAKRNIEGEISIEEAKKLIDSYYESKTSRTEDDDLLDAVRQLGEERGVREDRAVLPVIDQINGAELRLRTALCSDVDARSGCCLLDAVARLGADAGPVIQCERNGGLRQAELLC